MGGDRLHQLDVAPEPPDEAGDLLDAPARGLQSGGVRPQPRAAEGCCGKPPSSAGLVGVIA